MFCPKCGTNLNQDARFCSVCGTDVTAASAPAPAYAPVEPTPASPYAPMPEPAPKKNKGLKITLIVLISLLVAAAIGVGVYFLVTNSADSGTTESECEECGDKFEGSGDLCEDCEEEEKENKDSENKDSEEDKDSEVTDETANNREIVLDTKLCNQCFSIMDGEGLLCESCLEKIDYVNIYPGGGIGCFGCSTAIEENEVAVVDADGYAYCQDCDTGVYCWNCDMPLEEGDDDAECEYCADFSCISCGEVLEESEIAGQDDEGYCYCADCY